MKVKPVLGLTILVIGIVLFIFGVSSTNKVKEEVVESVTGRYTNETMWYIVGGVALIVVGSGITFKKRWS